MQRRGPGREAKAQQERYGRVFLPLGGAIGTAGRARGLHRQWGMFAIFTVLLVLTLSILVTKVATVALIHTGLSRESARFQARSAFTGVGFTTTESEQVVGHPVRRRILMLLMLMGNAGIVTVIGSLILGFTVQGEAGLGLWARLGLLAAGVGILLTLASSRLVDRWLSAGISRALKRWTRLDVRDYAGLLHLSGEYAVRELRVQTGDSIEGNTLAELRLRDEGLNVLGIERTDGCYVGAPRGGTRIEAGDVVIIYGREKALARLDERRRGSLAEWEHQEAVAEQRRVEEDQQLEEEQRLQHKEARGQPRAEKLSRRPTGDGASQRQS